MRRSSTTASIRSSSDHQAKADEKKPDIRRSGSLRSRSSSCTPQVRRTQSSLTRCSTSTSLSPATPMPRSRSLLSSASDRSRIVEFDAHEVYPGLWVGALSAAQDCKGLLERNIKSVVTVAQRLKPQVAWKSDEASSIEVQAVEIEDHPLANILDAIPRGLKAIDRAREAKISVLVHCASGISRSVTLCIAWLMLRKGLSLEAALQRVTSVRKAAEPNFGFMQSLRLLDEQAGDPGQRLKQAQAAWRTANNEDKRDAAVQKMRRAADKLSERANMLEEMLAQELGRAHCSPESGLRLCSQLDKLLTDIKAAEPTHCIDDTLAASMREVAAQKVLRLLSNRERFEQISRREDATGERNKRPEAMPTATLDPGNLAQAKPKTSDLRRSDTAPGVSSLADQDYEEALEAAKVVSQSNPISVTFLRKSLLSEATIPSLRDYRRTGPVPRSRRKIPFRLEPADDEEIIISL